MRKHEEDRSSLVHRIASSRSLLNGIDADGSKSPGSGLGTPRRSFSEGASPLAFARRMSRSGKSSRRLEDLPVVADEAGSASTTDDSGSTSSDSSDDTEEVEEVTNGHGLGLSHEVEEVTNGHGLGLSHEETDRPVSSLQSLDSPQ